MKYFRRYSSPIGMMVLGSDGQALTELQFAGQRHFQQLVEQGVENEDLEVFELTVKWLDVYFSGREPDFSIPIAPCGTEFQKQVWKVLQSIPYGKTMTYGQIAEILADERGIRKMSAQAVGQAAGNNPICLIIPCHRVIGSDGQLVGYDGGIQIKKHLLELEKVV